MKRKKLTTIVAIALALVMICGGIAIYAVGDANEKRISGEDTAKGTPEASIESEAKVTTEPEAETNEDSEAKITPEPEAVEGGESDEQLWKLQLADTPAYIGMFLKDYLTGDFYVNWIPGIEDEELVAEFVEMLNGIRMRRVTKDEYLNHMNETIQNANYNDRSSEGFRLYNAEGRSIGMVIFSRFATFEYGEDFYPADNPGWGNWLSLRLDNNSDCYTSTNSEKGYYIIDESTFDEELLERVWKECLCGVNPYDFIHNIDSVAAGNNPYGRNPINIYHNDALESYQEKYHGKRFDNVIAVPAN